MSGLSISTSLQIVKVAYTELVQQVKNAFNKAFAGAGASAMKRAEAAPSTNKSTASLTGCSGARIKHETAQAIQLRSAPVPMPTATQILATLHSVSTEQLNTFSTQVSPEYFSALANYVSRSAGSDVFHMESDANPNGKSHLKPDVKEAVARIIRHRDAGIADAFLNLAQLHLTDPPPLDVSVKNVNLSDNKLTTGSAWDESPLSSHIKLANLLGNKIASFPQAWVNAINANIYISEPITSSPAQLATFADAAIKNVNVSWPPRQTASK